MTIKDDIPGFHLNTQIFEENGNPKTLPRGYQYEIPLSLNAEICFSEFVNIEKKEKPAANKTVKVANLVEDLRDTSDILYNAYLDGQKTQKVISNIRRMKSVSP